VCPCVCVGTPVDRKLNAGSKQAIRWAPEPGCNPVSVPVLPELPDLLFVSHCPRICPIEQHSCTEGPGAVDEDTLCKAQVPQGAGL
jgi:hypothetical protein